MLRIFRSVYRINQFYKAAQQQFRGKNWQQALDLYAKSIKANPEYQQALIGQSKCMVNLQKHAEARSVLEGIASQKLSADEQQDLMQLRGRIELTKPDFDAARKFFEQSLELDGKERIRGAIYKLFCLTSTKKLKDYTEQLDTILRDKVKAKPYHYFEKGWILFQSKNFAAAVAMMDKCMQMGEINQYTYFYRGSSQRMLGKLKEAEKDFRESLKLDDQFADSLLALSDVLMNSDNLTEALAVCDKAVQLNPKLEFAVFNRSVCLFRMAQFERAEQSFNDALALNVTNPFGYLYRAMCRMELGRVEEALADFNKKIEIDPNNPDNFEVYMNMGMIHFQQQMYDKALQNFNSAQDMSPDDPEAMHQKGNCLAVLGKTEEAFLQINKAISKAPANLHYRYSQAALFIMKQEFKIAEKVLKECLEIDRSNPETYVKLAEFYLKTGEKEKSLDVLTKAEKLAPQNLAILFPKASLLAELGRNEESEQIFATLMKEFPDRLEIMLSRCQILLRLGKQAECTAILRQAEKLAPPELKAKIQQKLKAI